MCRMYVSKCVRSPYVWVDSHKLERKSLKTSKNVVKYDPLKRIFLGRFSYVETELSTNLRSEWIFIAVINIHTKFQLIMTTGTCNTRYSTYNFRWVELTSGWSKVQNFCSYVEILSFLTSVSPNYLHGI